MRRKFFPTDCTVLNLVKVGTRTIQFNISRRIDVTSNKSWLPEDPVNRGLDAPAVTTHAAVYPFKDSGLLFKCVLKDSLHDLCIAWIPSLYEARDRFTKCLMLTVCKTRFELKFACNMPTNKRDHRIEMPDLVTEMRITIFFF